MSGKFPFDTLPAATRPPVSFSAYLETPAKGVQIYAGGKNDAGENVWLHKGPEATLFDSEGRPFGKHYGGPTWEAPNGDKVAGALKASVPAPRPGDIPWLLLDIRSREGEGVFAQAKAILRVTRRAALRRLMSPWKAALSAFPMRRSISS